MKNEKRRPLTPEELDDFLSQVPEDEVDEQALEEFLDSQQPEQPTKQNATVPHIGRGGSPVRKITKAERYMLRKRFGEDYTDEQFEQIRYTQVFDNDLAGHDAWYLLGEDGGVNPHNLFVTKMVGRGDDKHEERVRFHPVNFPVMLYQYYALHTHQAHGKNAERDLYSLNFPIDDPECDGFYRRGVPYINHNVLTYWWPTATASQLEELDKHLYSFMSHNLRPMRPNRDVYVVGTDLRHPDALYVDPDTGEMTLSEGYVDPRDCVTTDYHLPVDYYGDPDFWSPANADAEKLESMELVHHFLDGPTGDDPRLVIRLLQIMAVMISKNKRGGGLIIARGRDTPGDGTSNGSNAKSAIFGSIARFFPGRVECSPLAGLDDSLGLGRVANGGLCWYSDDSGSFLSERMIELMKTHAFGGTTSANLKYQATPEQIADITFVIATNLNALNIPVRSNDFALLRRMVDMPFPVKMNKDNPHWVDNIEDRIDADPMAKAYLFFLMMQARKLFIRNGYKYFPVPEEYGGIAEEMLLNSNPVERWIRDSGQELLFGHHPEWHKIPRLYSLGASRYLVYPMDAEPSAAGYHTSLMSDTTWNNNARYKYFDVDSSTFRSRVPDGTRAVLACDRDFLYAHYVNWCHHNGVSPVKSPEWVNRLSSRTPTTSVQLHSGQQTPFGRTTLLLPVGVTYKKYVKRCCSESENDTTAVATANDYSRLEHMVEVVSGKGQLHLDQEHPSIDKWAALIIAQAALAGMGIIGENEKLAIRMDD